MADRSFNFAGFMIRWILALFLVFCTYNPSGYSWYHWLMGAENKIEPLLILAAVLLLIGWVIYVRATARSLGILGTLLALALFGTLVWALIYYQIISLSNTTLLSYIVLVILSAVMATGLSWSHIRRRISGQLDVDDRDDD
ncbi:DUF6524 family protein [Sedimenticola thiotaurini]|uniref:Uncharacterized protein n=1 Tax=Sedimenticola thiotaurini TaxID=1543721 RepID=A0A0F7JV71_9GAMM|nr:DUF6524 family protein [Sedimenticola thiotaurini]AKH19457.1 hypothetical protein AAY24_02830 [Sedimenticola thiotaurini]